MLSAALPATPDVLPGVFPWTMTYRDAVMVLPESLDATPALPPPRHAV
jgi:hypothetical protein